MTRQIEPSRSAAREPWLDNEALSAAMNAYGGLVTQWTRMQEESMRFFGERIKRDLQTAVEIVACKTPAEALEIEMRYASEAMSDYAAEYQKVAEMLAPDGELPKSSGANRRK